MAVWRSAMQTQPNLTPGHSAAIWQARLVLGPLYTPSERDDEAQIGTQPSRRAPPAVRHHGNPVGVRKGGQMDEEEESARVNQVRNCQQAA